MLLLTGAAGCHSSFVTAAGCMQVCRQVPDTESQTLRPPSVPPVATQGCVAQKPTASTDPCVRIGWLKQGVGGLGKVRVASPFHPLDNQALRAPGETKLQMCDRLDKKYS